MGTIKCTCGGNHITLFLSLVLLASMHSPFPWPLKTLPENGMKHDKFSATAFTAFGGFSEGIDRVWWYTSLSCCLESPLWREKMGAFSLPHPALNYLGRHSRYIGTDKHREVLSTFVGILREIRYYYYSTTLAILLPPSLTRASLW